MPIPRTLFDQSTPEDHDLTVTSGEWPADLGGELVLSAPHPDTFGGPHPFFGEGMTYRLSLDAGTHAAPDGAFAWRQKRIDSPSARLRAKRPDLFTATMMGVQSPFGVVNSANTAPLPWGDRLFMTWDVGRPTEIDPLTMEFLGDVGHRDQWNVFEISAQPLLPLVMSTAHPVIDPDRNVLWSVNTFWGQLHIVRWDGEGPIQTWPITDAIIPQSVHTITQTRDWLIVADCAFKVEPQVLSGGDRTEPANHEGPVYLIRKDELEAARPGSEVGCKTFRLAPEMNHYYAVYDDTDGIRVLFEHTENTDIAMTQGPGDVDALGRPCDPALRGLYGFPMSPDRNTVVEFDPSSAEVTHHAELRDPELLWTRQLNAMDWSTEGMAAPTLHHMVNQGWRPEAVTQKMLHLYRDRVDRSLWPADETAPLIMSCTRDDLAVTAMHELAMDDFPTSPIFVPRDPAARAGAGNSNGAGAGGNGGGNGANAGAGRGANGGAGSTGGRSRYAGANPGGHDGYVVVPVCNDDGFRVEVYDAAAVDKGPLATLAKPGMTVPFVLHSAWMPSVQAADRSRTRLRFADELGRVDELADDLAAVAKEVAAELDERVPLNA